MTLQPGVSDHKTEPFWLPTVQKWKARYGFLQIPTIYSTLLAQISEVFVTEVAVCLLLPPEFGVFPAGGVRIGQCQGVQLTGVTSFPLDAGGSVLHL